MCAEVSYGGFPPALRDVPGMRFRTLNEPFMSAVSSWLRLLASELHARDLLAPAGGPVVLVQLENEYSMVSGAYGADGEKYLQWCADMQDEMRLGVPAIMCFGAADGALETVNAFYAHDAVRGMREARPSQPVVWTECWTGWYDVWGAPHHRRSVEDVGYAVARFYAQGGSGHCYYMWMGGTNFGRSPMYLQATSYDYDAPVDEFGRMTTKARHVARLHELLLERYAPALFGRGEGGGGNISCPDGVQVGKGVICFVWSEALAFICNESSEVVDVTGGEVPGLDLRGLDSMAPMSVRLVDPNDGCAVLFDSAVVAEADVVTRSLKAASTSPPAGSWDWARRSEFLPTLQSALSRRHEIADFPPEQLRLTKDSSDYCFYSASYKWNSPETAAAALLEGVIFELEACDFVYVFVNDTFVGHSEEPLWEDRKNNAWQSASDPPAFSHRVKGALHTSCASLKSDDLSFKITVLVCALGLVKGDWQLGDGPSANMLEEKKGLLSQVKLVAQSHSSGGGGGNIGGQHNSLPLASRSSEWTAIAGLEGEAKSWSRGLAAAGGANAPFTVESKISGKDIREESSHLVWYEAIVKPERSASSWVLDLGSMGKGLLWVNGELLGRYWNVTGTRPRCGFLKGSPVVQDDAGPSTQRYYHIPSWLCEADAEETTPLLRITLFEERGHKANVTSVRLLTVV